MKIFNSKYTYLWVFLCGFFICAFGIGSSIIYILDEAKNSEAAREMWIYGQYFKPTFNNVIRTDKPPFHYFLMMLGYKLFGVNAFGARFFSAVFGGMTFLSTYIFTKKHLGKSIAQITFWILIASFYFVQEFHLAVPDPYLIFWVSLTFFCYIDFFISREKKILWLLYFSVGFGMLTKGPIALVLPSLIALIHLLLTKDLSVKTILDFRFIPGILLALLLSAPWFYMAHIATDGVFTDGFFFKHNLDRFQNKMEGHGGIFLITIGFVILGMFPFSFWLFRALIHSLKQKKQNAFVFYGGLTVFVFIGFFAISSTKLPNYTMPCYPMIAVLLAWYFYTELKPKYLEGNLKAFKIEWISLMVISIALPIAGYIGLDLEKQLGNKGWVGLLIAFVPLGVIWAYRQFIRKQVNKSFKTLVSTFALLSLMLFGVAFPILTKGTPVEVYKNKVGTQKQVVVFKRFDAAFPINFDRTYKVVNTLEEIDAFFERYPEGVVMTKTRKKEDLKKLEVYSLVFQQKSLFENHTTRVYQKSKK
ncbi:ArnT family glycosyltransferase [Ochrovirga pacifica]|uniref:ArnT family glycosyltransferase n=1 Tax=Ochrovirga pacifica TaxID=1042376 RepID=UPI000255A4E3|nr:glycosyltransferase family 39 protein [Ochrovirga pacifica]